MLIKKVKNRLNLQIVGVNLKRLIKNLYKNNISIYNLNFISHKEVTLEITKKDYIKSANLLKPYKVNIVKQSGFLKLKQFSLLHLGILIGLIFFSLMLFLNNNYLSKICVFGNNKLEKSEIINYLNKNLVKEKSFFNNIDIDLIEKELSNKFSEISFCSVIKKGTNLIVNIKEKIFAEDLINSSNIYAKEDGLILNINLVQGTAKVKVGDSVKKGDILVEGLNNNIPCTAIADISMTVWYKDSYTFYNETIKTERTGKKVVNSCLKIFNKTIKIKNNENKFENYEKEVVESYIFENNILPIKIFKEKFYEIIEICEKKEFSNEKDAIIELTKKNALEIVPENVKINNITTEISDFSLGKIITTYVETVQSVS